jgi:hypothetical protein
VDDFLGVVDVKSGTGEDLYSAAITMIEGNLKLKIASCIGFGSGNRSAFSLGMLSEYNSPNHPRFI